MKKLVLLFLILGFISSKSQVVSHEVIADRFINLLNSKKFDVAHKMFDSTMTQQINVAQLTQMWDGVISQYGNLNKSKILSSSTYKNYEIIIDELEFEKITLNARIVFDQDNLIAGLFLQPGKSQVNFKIPNYVNQDSFTEQEVEFGSSEFPINGTLSIPKNGKNFPLVILVHGSGPNDKDETIGGNKPFRDIAWGLASQGIAVLRYNKRTFTHGVKIAGDSLTFLNFTLKEETIDDAIAASEFCYKNSDKFNINKDKIVVLGHSLGGFAIPSIASKVDKVAGFVIMAGMARPFDEVLKEQYIYIFNEDGKISDKENESLVNLEKQLVNYRNLNLNKFIDKDSLPLGMGYKYCLDFKNINLNNLCSKFTKPVFVIQGDRDYQITEADFSLWKTLLKNNKKAEFKLFEKLNHLFIYGDNKCYPSEYMNSGNVDQKVIESLKNWVLTIP